MTFFNDLFLTISNWFNQRSSREQNILKVFSIFICCWLIYQFVWINYVEIKQKYTNEYQQNEQNLIFTQQASRQLAKLYQEDKILNPSNFEKRVRQTLNKYSTNIRIIFREDNGSKKFDLTWEGTKPHLIFSALEEIILIGAQMESLNFVSNENAYRIETILIAQER